MQVENLIKNKTYKYIVPGNCILLVYRYETINHWFFDVVDTSRFLLLGKIQIENNIFEN